MLPFLFLRMFGGKKYRELGGRGEKGSHERGAWHQNTHFITTRIIFISCLH